MATVRKRGPHQYQARIRVKGYPELSNTFTTRRDAISWGNEKERELLQGLNAAEDQAQKLTLRDALDRYAREVLPEKKGRAQELRRIQAWQKHSIAVRSLASIRGADLARHRDARLEAGAGANTVRLELAVISHLYEVARKDWGLETQENPVKAIRKPKLPRGRDRRLLPGEEELLMAIQAISAELRRPYDKAVLHRDKEYEDIVWSTADGEELFRGLATMYDSYRLVIQQRPDRPVLDKQKYAEYIRKLKTPAYGPVLQQLQGRAGWYTYKEKMLRGYVRMQADANQVELVGDFHIPKQQTHVPINARVGYRGSSVPRGVKLREDD